MLGMTIDTDNEIIRNEKKKEIERYTDFLIASKLREKQIGMLPHNIHEAVGALEEDGILREMLGYELTEHMIQAKRQEWKDFLLEVTPWEVDRYL